MAVEYYIDNTQLGFLVSDAERNLILYMYQPDAQESHGGHRLIRKADFHVGQTVSTLFRIRCKIVDPTTDKCHPPVIEKRQMIGLGTLDGGIGYLLPVPEKTYRRLQVNSTRFGRDCNVDLIGIVFYDRCCTTCSILR